MTPFQNSRRHFLGTACAAMIAAPRFARGAGARGFEIGLVADAQYADVDTKGTRHYRRSLEKLGAAVEHFNGRDLAFCVHLGDLIDREWRSFDEITRPLATSRHRWHQLLGNHDFDVREELKEGVPRRLGMPWRYGLIEHGDFHFLILDTNDLSTYAYAAGHPQRLAAEARLRDLQTARLRQAKPWNGALGEAQVAWFARQCAAAQAAGKKVVVFSHHPVFPDNEHNVWNAAELLAVVDRHANVVAWLCGHNHAGAFGVRAGVPYVTLKGMVETADTTAFSTARLLDDRLVLEGHGREPSRELRFRQA